MTNLTMGQRIAGERKKLGLSQEALGEKTGVSRQAISKWESDSAVPEIDKLIALSRLFGVSVGWLLGVEEELAPREEAQTDTLSEKQLQMVEQIVKKYQPRRTLRLQWLTIIAILIILLAAAWDFNFRLNSGHLDYGDLYTQLAEVRTQIQTLKDTQSQNGLVLLADYQFDLEQLADAPGVRVHFSAIPNLWQEGDSGYLTVTRKDMETLRVDCEWNGAWLVGTFPLDAADGYSFCLTIVHAGGTQEQQLLRDETLEDLAQSLSIDTRKVAAEQVWYVNNAFSLFNCEISVTMPGVGYVYGQQKWQTVDLLLYQGGEEKGRFNLLLADSGGTEADESVLNSPSLTSIYGSIRFENVELVQNEEIVLYLSAQLNNGMSTQSRIGSWVLDANGELIEQ